MQPGFVLHFSTGARPVWREEMFASTPASCSRTLPGNSAVERDPRVNTVGELTSSAVGR